MLLETLKVFSFLFRERFKKEEYSGKTFTKDYLLRFLDSARFMNTSLDTLVNTLSPKIYKKSVNIVRN